MTYRDDLEAAHARIAALEAELAASHTGTPEWSAERARLVAELEAARRTSATAESQLVRDLETARRELAQARDELARARTESAGYVERIRVLQDQRAKHVATPTSNQPARLDRGAEPICPHCRKGGRDVRLLRDRELTPGVCPQCAAVTLLR